MDKSDSVTAAEVIRNFGYWQEQALLKPLVVTHHRRARVMLVSTDMFDAMNSADPGDHRGVDPIAAIEANTAEGFVVLDADLVVREMNDAALTWLGIDRASVVGQPIERLNPSPVYLSMLRRVLRTGEALTFEVASTVAPATRLSVRSFPYGEHVASIFIDITEQERLQVTADEMEALKAALALLGMVGTARVDGRGRIIETDALFMQITGMAQGGAGEGMLEDLFAPAARAALRQALQTVVTEGTCQSVRSAGRRSGALDLSFAPLEAGSDIPGAVVAVKRAAQQEGAQP